jgi:hypothetical protein
LEKREGLVYNEKLIGGEIAMLGDKSVPMPLCASKHRFFVEA